MDYVILCGKQKIWSEVAHDEMFLRAKPENRVRPKVEKSKNARTVANLTMNSTLIPRSAGEQPALHPMKETLLRLAKD